MLSCAGICGVLKFHRPPPASKSGCVASRMLKEFSNCHSEPFTVILIPQVAEKDAPAAQGKLREESRKSLSSRAGFLASLE